MELGLIGLGKMGGNMGERLLRGGHTIVCYDNNKEFVKKLASSGAAASDSIADFCSKLSAPRIIWLMLPAGAVIDKVIYELVSMIKQDDIIVDGGNSNYKETIRRASMLKGFGIHYIDVGTSGGVWGLKNGYSLMIGGDKRIADKLTPIFQTLAPAKDKGWGYVGKSGSGHFVKMIHNGIEYGMMQSFSEGFEIMEKKKDFELDLLKISEIWQNGSVVRSWLLDLINEILKENPALSGIEPFVEDSGEGRLTVSEAFDLGVPAPIITLSLIQRLSSRDKDSYEYKMLAMMRNKFGGHKVLTPEEK